MSRTGSHKTVSSRVLPVLATLVLCAGTARADVALLKNGRSLSVTSYRVEGEQILLMIEGGGQIALPNAQVVAIRRDQPGANPPPETPGAEKTALETPRPVPPAELSAVPKAEGLIAIEPKDVFDREAL